MNYCLILRVYSGSEFTITNMDQDELRKSQRKKKPPSITIQPSNSTYGSNESDDDDDDVNISKLNLNNRN